MFLEISLGGSEDKLNFLSSHIGHCLISQFFRDRVNKMNTQSVYQLLIQDASILISSIFIYIFGCF